MTKVVANSGTYRKGHKKAGGRQKGTANKNTTALKDMILNALDKAGGEKYLMKQAEENPTAFMTLIGKVLPTTLAGDKDNPVQVKRIVEYVKSKELDPRSI